MQLQETRPCVWTADVDGVTLEVYGTKAIVDALTGDKSLVQLQNVAKLPGIIQKSIMMPDGHQGYGFPIGGVAAFDSKTGIISPGGIGFDINCGVRAQATNLTIAQVRPHLAQLLDEIYKRVPVGQGGEGSIKLTHQELDQVFIHGMQWALTKGYATQDDIDRCEAGGMLAGANPALISPTAKARAKNQLGTLGGGNHFIELQVVEEILDPLVAARFRISEPGQIIIMIHSGSRGAGHQTCTEYLRKMEDFFPQIAAALPERDLIYAPFSSQIAQDYYHAMNACANFAWVNRFLMAKAVEDAFKKVMGNEVVIQSIYDVAHNIAKREMHTVDDVLREVLVHRKGATRAFAAGHPELPDVYKDTGHPVLIPGSMGTPSYILVGTPGAMQYTFGSIAHGSGRVMSRHMAVQKFNGEKVAADLAEKGILVKAPKLSAIADESPGVYKDSAAVIESVVCAGIARAIVKLRPLGVIKG
ncbi:MAG TPA: RtcB family protein [Acidobacteriota bacterium]|nr:RtcB family protein [Acidobacteriota bacterium]